MTSMRFIGTTALGVGTAIVVFSLHQATMRRTLDAADPSADEAAAPAGRQPEPATTGAEAPQSGAAGSDSGSSRPRSQAQHLQSGMPESFRNTSILMAIRDAGYVCTDIVSSASGARDMAAWRVACDDALVYLVSVDDAGSVVVDPIPYAEGIRMPIEREVPPPADEQVFPLR